MDKSTFEKYSANFVKNRNKARLVEDNARYTSIDFRAKNGSSFLYVNYLIDKVLGNLVISGDLGSCIASWNNALDLEKAVILVRDVPYFAEKIKASSFPITVCYSDLVAEDIMEMIKQYWINNPEEYIGFFEEEEVLEFSDPIELPEGFEEEWTEFKNRIWANTVENRFNPDEGQRQFLKKYLGPDWYMRDIGSAGTRIDDTVYRFSVGLQMAAAQLGKA